MFANRYPLASIDGLGRQMNRFFDDAFEGFTVLGSPRTWAFPPMNVWEEEDGVFVEVELPGLSLDDIDVQVTGNELKIKGQRSVAQDDRHTYRCRERHAGEFTRTLTLPFDVDIDHVEATLKDGVLTVKLPKAETAKAKKIAVKTR